MSRTRLIGALAAIAGLAALGSCTDENVLETPLAPNAVSDAKFFNQNDFEQCQTGNPRDVCNWVNGVLNSTHAILYEDDANPQKLIIPSASTTDNYLILQYGLQKDIHGNYDGIVRYDNGSGPFNPCTDTQAKMDQFCDGGILDATVPLEVGDIPATTPGAALAAATTAMGAFYARYKGGAQLARQFVIYGADWVEVEPPTFEASGDAVLATIKINFTRDPGWTGDLLALWGMHVSYVGDWSQAECETAIDCTGAAGQSGAPFHTKLQEYWNGTDLVQPGAMALNMMGDVVVRNPTAWITLSPLTDDNSIGEDHTVTVTVMKDPDDGSGPQPATDADVDFTLTNDGTSSYVLDTAASTCDDPGTNVDSNGQCVIVFTSTSAGQVTVHASATVTLDGQQVTVSTDGVGNNTGDATKDFVDGSIAWTKVDGAGAPLAGATFDVCLIELWDSDANGGAGGFVDVTDDCQVTSDATAGPAGSNWYDDQDLDGAEFLLDGLVLGKYVISEKTAPAGYNKDDRADTVELTLASPDKTIAAAFVNTAPALRIKISPLDDDNSIGEDHTLTATAEKDVNGTGSWVAVENGVTLTFAIESGTASFVGGVNTCLTAGGTGSCSVDITSNTAGTVYVSAAVSLTIGTVSLNAKTGTGGENSANARKDFIDGSIAWTKVDGAGAPLAGATFDVCLIELWDSDANGGAGGFVDVADDCQVTSDATAGPAGSNWYDDQDLDGAEFLLDPLVLGKYVISEKTAPAGYNKDDRADTVELTLASPDKTIAAAFVNTAPALRIKISPLDDDNSIGEDHTLTATAEKDVNGTGSWVAVENGVTLTFAIESGTASFVGGVNTCLTAGGTGSCSVDITSNTAGTVYVSAAVSLTVGSIPLNAKTGTGGENSANARKDFVDGSIAWVKKDGTGALLAGATFDVCLIELWDSDANGGAGGYTDVADDCHVVSDATAGPVGSNWYDDQDTDGGEFLLDPLVLGKYTVQEKDPPSSAYNKDPDLVTVSLSLASPDKTIATAFVNPKPALKISISPLTGQNSIEDDHTLTATAMYDPEGDGSFTAVPDGSTIQFAFEVNAIGATFVGPSSCATTGGSCSAVITSDNAGQVTVSAAISLTVGAVSLNAKTGTGGLNGANATKDFIAGMLYWEKHADSSTGPLQGGATFEVCRTYDYDPATTSFSAITPVCFSPDILDNDSRDQDADNGEFKLIDLVLGRYTIRETIAPFGYMKDPNTHTVDVTSSSAVNGGIFVNLPLTRGELHPTQTTCEAFRDQTIDPLEFLYAQRKGTAINTVSPGVFFFYTEVVLAENGGAVRVTESNGPLPLFQILNGQAFLYNDDCVKLETMSLINGDTGAQISPAGGQAGDTYIVGIKYSTDALNGQNYNALPQAYTFTAEASSGAAWLFLNSDMLTVVKKQN